MAGKVYSDTKRLDKSGMQFNKDLVIELKGNDHPWVSRGGVKLEHGIKAFGLDIRDSVCLDIGASTGGFSHVLLKNGAKRIYAVDVGHGQLAWEIRNNNRVVVIERFNARYLTPKEVPEKVDFICCDASFIGLKTILPAALQLAGSNALLLALIKPQFEVGKEHVGRKGVVRDISLHQKVCIDISDWLTNLKNWSVLGVEQSPIKGPKGNIEFLVVAKFIGR
tara:strand:- start:6167 stop:6832 length:666 start_codon:yes stop_codon:yes gene_type:complete